MRIPTPSGSLGRLVGPSLGETVDPEALPYRGVQRGISFGNSFHLLVEGVTLAITTEICRI
jgi:hypothetical protein